jgi:hypothetical protein
MDNTKKSRVIGDHFKSMQDSIVNLGIVAKNLDHIPRTSIDIQRDEISAKWKIVQCLSSTAIFLVSTSISLPHSPAQR